MTGCARQSAETPPVSIDQVTADLRTISDARVFFAHQSVGRNLLAGVRALAAEAGVPLRIVDLKAGETPDGTGLFHTFIGENGTPDLKVSEFVAEVASSPASAFDVAMLKFCYLDLDDESREPSPGELLARYESSMATLSSQRPQTTLIHATIPLTADPPGWKTMLKRWLGRSTWTDSANRKRGDYNQQLRQHYPEGEIFDIARLEATRPDGELSSFTVDGRVVETMFGGYTYDGGHLTEGAGRHMAAEFLHTVASAVRRNHSAESSPQIAPK